MVRPENYTGSQQRREGRKAVGIRATVDNPVMFIC